MDNLLEVLKHQGLVAQQLLVFHQRADLILLYFFAFALLQNGHGIEVVLTEKDNIQTCLFEFSQLKGEGALGEDGNVLAVGDKAENLKTKMSVFCLTLIESLLSCMVGSIRRRSGDLSKALFFFSLFSFA